MAVVRDVPDHPRDRSGVALDHQPKRFGIALAHALEHFLFIHPAASRAKSVLPCYTTGARESSMESLSFRQTVPAEPGEYTWVADLIVPGQEPICSIREGKVVVAK